MTKARSNATANAAKGDLTVGSGTNLSGVLGVGSNGDTIVADSSTSTGLRWQGDFAAGKNKIINGDFGIWQRGTSFSTFGMTADRWGYGWGGGTGITGTITQQTFTPGTAPVSGYEGTFFLRHNITNTGGATSVEIESKLEDVRLFANQTVTVSAWLKADAARTFKFEVVQDFGSGGSSAVKTSGSTQTLTTGWVRYTQTISVPTISGKTIGTGSNLRARLTIDPANYTVDIWGVQIEAGSVATAFQTATGTIQGELAACQRYYWRQTATGNAYSKFGLGVGNGATDYQMSMTNPVAMRVPPTSVDSSSLAVLDGVAIIAVSAVALNAATNLIGGISATGTGFTAGRGGTLIANNNVAAYIGFSAEL